MTVPEDLAGLRLDQALAALFPEHSRTRLRHWLEQGQIRVAGNAQRARDAVRGGECISLEVMDEPRAADPRAEAIALRIVYEDETLLVIDKPAGLSVHPGAGRPAGTLLNALLHHAPELAALPRAGLVHRLDKDTTGLLVVARSLAAHTALTRQLAARTVAREYQAVVRGALTGGGTVDAPIARHRTERTHMAVRGDGRAALTHYRLLARFRAHTHIAVHLETGRTHQIRVHMAHVGYPLVGDAAYGGRRPVAGVSAALAVVLAQFPRQALHAFRLGLVHPRTDAPMTWEAPLPLDFQALLAALRQDVDAGA